MNAISMQNFKKDYGAFAVEIPRLELLLVQICPDALLRAQCPGDQVLPGMSTGLLGGDVPPRHHVLHHRVVPGQAGDPVFIDVIGPAVSDVEQISGLLHHQGRHHSGAHAAAVRVSDGPVIDCRIGGLRGPRKNGGWPRLAIAIRLHALQGVHEGFHGDETGDIARLGPAHPVAHDADRQVL